MTMAHATQSATILIVEDETLVRMNGVDILEDAGFRVIEAETADDALAVLEGTGDVHLLFSDIDMPGSMDGLALATLVHERWPNIRLLMTSGHHRVPETDLPDDGEFVSKPYSGAEIVKRVRAQLHSI